MKKIWCLLAVVGIIIVVVAPKEKDIEKSFAKNDLVHITCYSTGEYEVAEKEYPHRLYAATIEAKFVWYKLRFVYKATSYRPVMAENGTQLCIDMKTFEEFPISSLPEYDESTEVKYIGKK